MPPKNPGNTSFLYGLRMVLAGFIILAVVWGGIYSFGTFLKALSAEFGWTRAATSASYSILMFVYGLLCLVSGRLSDRFGPGIVVTACGILSGLGYILLSRITGLWQFYAIYGLVIAAGASGAMVPLTSTAARWFVKKRAMMTAILLSGFGAGLILGPPASGWLISSYGWRTAYFVTGIVTLLVPVLIARLLKRDPGKMGLVPYGENEIKREDVAFISSELPPYGEIHTWQFWTLAIISLFWGIILNATLVHFVPHATDVGTSAANAANMMAIIGGLNIAGRLVMGGLGERTGGKLALMIGFIFLSVSLLSLQLKEMLWVFYFFAVVFGFGYGITGTFIPVLVAELFGTRTHGATLGIIVFSFSVGGVIGPVLSGFIFDTTTSYYLAFLVYTLLGITGLLLTSFLKPVTNKKAKREC